MLSAVGGGRPARQHLRRGQTFPILGGLTVLAFTFFAINYADALRWQIRAQNAADDAAKAAMVGQSMQINQIQTIMYASTIEEVRIRRLLDDMLLLNRRSGDCTWTMTYENLCGALYGRIRRGYIAAVRRYDYDIRVLSKVASLDYTDMGYARPGGGAPSGISGKLVAAMNGAGCTALRADCAFQYTLQDYSHRSDPSRRPHYLVADAAAITAGNPLGNEPSANYVRSELVPMNDEVTVCAWVSPGIRNFFGLKSPKMRVAARAAATVAPVVQEVVMPGSQTVPGGGLLQPVESYSVPTSGMLFKSDGWYDVAFSSGNDWTEDGSGTYVKGGVADTSLLVAVNWWRPILISPYLGTGVTIDPKTDCAGSP